MSEKQYPLHHDHGTVTISRDVFDSMTSELERLRPMETGLELAEADRDAYKKRAEELSDKLNKLAKDHDRAIQACCDADKRITRLKHAFWIAKASRFRSGYFHFDLEKDFWADRNDQEKENHYYEKREQCSRLEAKCRERAKRFE